MAKQIQKVHIFSTGTHNKKAFDDADLEAIATAFAKTRQAGRVPLKFGHNDQQPFTDGQPAIGWVESVWKEGKKLFANFTGVPDAVYDLIKKGAYKFVSIELLRNLKWEGQTLPFVLDAIALLGADQPAVRDIEDMSKLTMKHEASTYAEVLCFTQEHQSHGAKKAMDEEAVKKLIAAAVDPLKTELAAVTAERDTFKADNEKLKATAVEAEKKAKAEKVKFARDGANEILEAAVTTQKISPAQREVFSESLGITDDERVLSVNLEHVRKMVGVDDAAMKLHMSRKSTARDEKGVKGEVKNETDQFGDFRDRYNAAIAAHQLAHPGKDRFTASAEVLQLNPAMAREFSAQCFDTSKEAA